MNPNRVDGGREGKLGGHRFEHSLAKHLGLPSESVDGGNRTKVDVDGIRYAHEYGNISVKNPSGVNTQLFLTTPNSFLQHFNPPIDVESFIGLFFGQVDRFEFERLCGDFGIDVDKLHREMEVRRQRVLTHNIPDRLTQSALNWLNSKKDELFSLLFEKGYPGWDNSANTLAWAWLKNDVGSVRYYSMSDLKQLYLRSEWIVPSSGSTLWCTVNGVKLLHLQMKGSGQPKYVSWGYHGMMFHIHSTGLRMIEPL